MKKLLLLAVLSGAAVFSGTAVMSGCSGDNGGGTGGSGGGNGGGSGGGSGKTLCSDDSQCASGHICDPGAKVCVQKCSVGQDCTEDTNSSCGNTISPGGSSSVCHCATDGTCNMAFPGTICDAIDQVCVLKCTSNSECPTDRTCNTTSGQCEKVEVDAGTSCTTAGTCGTGEICNYTTSKCETSPSCTAANAEPDTCPYNDVCNSAGACDEILGPTCGNFTSDGSYTAWNPASDNGPVIYYMTDGTDDLGSGGTPAFCTSGSYAHTVVLNAYWTQAWPNKLNMVANFHYVTTSGSEIDATTIGRPTSGISSSGNDVTITVTLCAMTGSPLTAGFYFTGGNGYCFTTNGGTLTP